MTTIKTTTQSSYGKWVGSALAAFALIAVGTAAVAATEAGPTATQKVEKAQKKVEKVMSDTWITTKVKSEILANSASKAFKVEVITKSGVVTLNGKLPNKDAVDLVKMIAEKVEGVHSVNATGLTVEG